MNSLKLFVDNKNLNKISVIEGPIPYRVADVQSDATVAGFVHIDDAIQFLINKGGDKVAMDLDGLERDVSKFSGDLLSKSQILESLSKVLINEMKKFVTQKNKPLSEILNEAVEKSFQEPPAKVKSGVVKSGLKSK